MIHPYLADHLSEISMICRYHKVSKLHAFGSIVDNRFKVGVSDIDLLIEFNQNDLSKTDISRTLLILWMEFQNVLQCNVDLLLNDNIKGKYFKKYLELYKVKIFDIDDIGGQTLTDYIACR